MFTIEFVVTNGQQYSVIDRMTSAAGNIGFAEETARTLLDSAASRYPATPPNGYVITDQSTRAVLKSWGI
jgi:hypothetical protein